MKVVFKEQTQIHPLHNESSFAIDVPTNDPTLNIAVSTIKGRYPAQNRAVNLHSKELAYVLSGYGKVEVDGTLVTFKAGDTILIFAGEKYYWEGDFTIAVTWTPAWTPQQHRIVT
jgi:quercetin dioxygenase-like cupin family protein